jgi:predicted oxidoreductase
VSTSLARLGTDYLDSLVLHSLYPTIEDTLVAWNAMEKLVPSKVSALGLSNVDVESLRRVCQVATIKPSTVQNRFTRDLVPNPKADLPPGLPYPQVPYDRDVRDECKRQGVTYVLWGLLWGNPEITEGSSGQKLQNMAEKMDVSSQATLYACMRSMEGCNWSILCGTTMETKMHGVLDGLVVINEYLHKNEEHLKEWKEFVHFIEHIIDTEELKCS